MVENGCAFVCFIFSAICAFLTAFCMMEGEVGAMALVTVFGLIIMVVSACALMNKNFF